MIPSVLKKCTVVCTQISTATGVDEAFSGREPYFMIYKLKSFEHQLHVHHEGLLKTALHCQSRAVANATLRSGKNSRHT